jgi:hypothetical protein
MCLQVRNFSVSAEGNTMSKGTKVNSNRRQALRTLGLGAAGAVFGVVAATDKIFAKQFAADVAPTKLPEMLYDPKLQMMVDPVTKQPVYLDSRKLATINATITAGCSNCPKCDDACG